MYRYSIDDAITYSSEDINLFKESPFASWMERLTLENPHHGIAPDRDGGGPKSAGGRHPPGTVAPDAKSGAIEQLDWEQLVTFRQAPTSSEAGYENELVETLIEKGTVVVLIDQTKDEFLRRSETLEAMRNGADLIVRGQLASGPLSETADLLMRTSGFSDLGNYLYIPCDISPKTTPDNAFRLCFLADLLHSLQGQLPPQMMIIRSDSNMVTLPTEDHIYYYRGVKQRFMTAQGSFRKHRMPDPAASAHFGRWSTCARDVLKQRSLGEDVSADQEVGVAENTEVMPAQVALAQGDYPEASAGSESPPQLVTHQPDSQRALQTLDYKNNTGRIGGRAYTENVFHREVREYPSEGRFLSRKVTRSAPISTPISASTSTSISVKHDLPGRKSPKYGSGTRPHSQPLIDRDAAIYLSEEVPSLSTTHVRFSLPDADDYVAEHPRKPHMPFSNVLITSTDPDY